MINRLTFFWNRKTATCWWMCILLLLPQVAWSKALTKNTLLDAEAFSLKPDALLAWQSPDRLEDTDVEVFIQNVQTKVDNEHLEETTNHSIYRIQASGEWRIGAQSGRGMHLGISCDRVSVPE